ncbi:MAG: hypothetical protein H0T62_12600 [Parachlamydiaceae bacterium]|nr:hypothetical protein [Parachlamydiaceae bacterium]
MVINVIKDAENSDFFHHSFDILIRIAVIDPYYKAQIFEMLALAIQRWKILTGLAEDRKWNTSLFLNVVLPFKTAAKVDFVRAKEIAEELDNPCERLIALTSVVEGFISK